MSEGNGAVRQRVRLYWNHICILHNFEKQYLARLAGCLAERGIDLEVTYFGLGYASHMAEYLAQDGAELPDVVVSADLEVFEHPAVAAKLDGRYACEGWMPLKDTPAVRAARRDETLLPVVIIPIVFYGAACAGEPLLEVARTRRLAFGGINNSAGKTAVKAIWGRYGREAASELLERATVADMPIGAFQSVRTGGADVALVPSLCAMRSDGETTFEGVPVEGPLLLPSYVLARDSVPERTARAVVDELLSEELLGFYAQNGDLVVCADGRASARSRYEGADPVWAVTPEVLGMMDCGEFYDLYCWALPAARRFSFSDSSCRVKATAGSGRVEAGQCWGGAGQ